MRGFAKRRSVGRSIVVRLQQKPLFELDLRFRPSQQQDQERQQQQQQQQRGERQLQETFKTNYLEETSFSPAHSARTVKMGRFWGARFGLINNLQQQQHSLQTQTSQSVSYLVRRTNGRTDS